MCESMEKFTTWTITGSAALVGSIISNLESINAIISVSSLKHFILLFVALLVFGVTSKMYGMASFPGINLLNNMDNQLSSPLGQSLMDSMSIEPKQLADELAKPY